MFSNSSRVEEDEVLAFLHDPIDAIEIPTLIQDIDEYNECQRREVEKME